MNTTWTTSILSGLATEDILPWRERILPLGEVHVNKSSRMGLAMMRGRESVEQQVFNGGEILITECSVTVDGQPGFGMCMGYDANRAEMLALLDAVLHCPGEKWQKLKQDLHFWLQEWAIEQEEAEEHRFRLIQRTRVNFEMMDEWEDQ